MLAIIVKFDQSHIYMFRSWDPCEEVLFRNIKFKHDTDEEIFGLLL